MNQDCLFCKISTGDIPADRIYEDDKVIAFSDINPQAPFHALVIPREHIATINDLTTDNSELLAHMILTAKTIADDNGFSEPGYRLIMNCNEQGGQTVYHIHLHILAGRQLRGLG
ncbi:MAG: histidine triad (HIT) family protein [Candidatus Azotimanducaceae bacterium]|jgi:histidine triad (HIT) family protein